MNKLKQIAFLLILVGISLTSCKKDDDGEPVDKTPNINFKGGDGYISSDATVYTGDEFTIGITASSNANSGKKLISVKYTATANNTIVMEHDSVFKESSYDVNYRFRLDTPGEVVFKFEVTDKDQEKSSLSVTITAENATTPLGAEEDLFWQRIAGNPATGLDGFGLKWTSNALRINAQITKDGADKLVHLSSDSWTTIETVEALEEAINAAADMETFDGIQVDANATYDEVIATSYNGQFFMMHLTSTEIVVDNDGTTVKIFGKSKK